MEKRRWEVQQLLLTSINCSTANSLPLMGSVPFSAMYFSIRRFSKIQPEAGDTTGCSGNSLETKIKSKNEISYEKIQVPGEKCEPASRCLLRITIVWSASIQLLLEGALWDKWLRCVCNLETIESGGKFSRVSCMAIVDYLRAQVNDILIR